MRMMNEEEKKREIHTPVETLTDRHLSSNSIKPSSDGLNSTTYNKRMSEYRSRMTIVGNAQTTALSPVSKGCDELEVEDSDSNSMDNTNFFCMDRTRI